jgi:hypothetical protein
MEAGILLRGNGRCNYRPRKMHLQTGSLSSSSFVVSLVTAAGVLSVTGHWIARAGPGESAAAAAGAATVSSAARRVGRAKAARAQARARPGLRRLQTRGSLESEHVRVMSESDPPVTPALPPPGRA